MSERNQLNRTPEKGAPADHIATAAQHQIHLDAYGSHHAGARLHQSRGHECNTIEVTPLHLDKKLQSDPACPLTADAPPAVERQAPPPKPGDKPAQSIPLDEMLKQSFVIEKPL